MDNDEQRRKLTTAVIPAGGNGTRLYPLTSSTPKEMLPVFEKTMIMHSIEELYDSGITEIILISNVGKPSLSDFLLPNSPTDEIPKLPGYFSDILDKIHIQIIMQEEQLGLGNAILQCSKLINDSDFIVILPDELFFSETPSTKILIENWNLNPAIYLSAVDVPNEEIRNYGVIKYIENLKVRALTPEKIAEVIEKPETQEAPSNSIINGRYILPSSLFRVLEEASPGVGGEIQLTDSINELIKKDLPAYAMTIDGVRFDAGSPLGLLKSSIYSALQEKNSSESILKFMKSYII